MKIKQRYLALPFLLILLILCVSWGNTGHYKISLSFNLHLPSEMEEFQSWNAYLADHASDADWRRDDDPDEGPKHYIDIDNYSEFVENGTISQDLQELISQYGAGFVEDNGYLPWATIASYDSLVSCFLRRDWDKAKFFAADLGHYVADGFMPLHITRNYNGQFTDNYGIHGRFESDMINRVKDQIVIDAGEPDAIDNVSDYIFAYIYSNYPYVDSILLADNYGKAEESNTSSSVYLDAMWEYSEEFTVKLFNEASRAFASLFRKAWESAGKPLPSGPGVSVTNPLPGNILSVYPNPATEKLFIRIDRKPEAVSSMGIYNSGGKLVEYISPSMLMTGNAEIECNLQAYHPGEYTLVYRTADSRHALNFLVVR